jgi:hypothetical protein
VLKPTAKILPPVSESSIRPVPGWQSDLMRPTRESILNREAERSSGGSSPLLAPVNQRVNISGSTVLSAVRLHPVINGKRKIATQTTDRARTGKKSQILIPIQLLKIFPVPADPENLVDPDNRKNFTDLVAQPVENQPAVILNDSPLKINKYGHGTRIELRHLTHIKRDIRMRAAYCSIEISAYSGKVFNDEFTFKNNNRPGIECPHCYYHSTPVLQVAGSFISPGLALRAL